MKKTNKSALMIQGTGSNVGKSLMVAGLGRLFVRRGLKVLPFKPQNMSNNAAVTQQGGEIGRAQALQARACFQTPTVDMNPVLLKPETDRRAQVVVQGKVIKSSEAMAYGDLKARLLEAIMQSFERISEEAELVLIEGAGSPAEVNLRDRDIANMGFVKHARVPVVLLGDIDRGGVIASLVGTHTVLTPEERDFVQGFIINKFRGDLRLFEDGLRIIQDYTGWQSHGVVPHLSYLKQLPAEDAVPIENCVSKGAADLHVAVPMLSRISNFDDLDPLSAEPGVSVEMIPPGQPLPPNADLVVLPGSKATIYDLEFFRAQGWDIDLMAHHRRGGWIVGICAGFQMLGTHLYDPDTIEGGSMETTGLGYLDIQTHMVGEKSLKQVVGKDAESNLPISGYEIHNGRLSGPGLERPWLVLEYGPEGCVSPDHRVYGTSIHGIFHQDDFRRAWLKRLGFQGRHRFSFEHQIEATLDRFAQELEQCLDIEGLLTIANQQLK